MENKKYNLFFGSLYIICAMICIFICAFSQLTTGAALFLTITGIFCLIFGIIHSGQFFN